MKISIKAGDDAIEFRSTLVRNGTPVNLTGSTVKFLMKFKTIRGPAYSFDADIVSAIAGTVKYSPTQDLPTVAGNYDQEWEVTFADNTVLTFPSEGYNLIVISDDLN